jgi:hypothetical protein
VDKSAEWEINSQYRELRQDCHKPGKGEYLVVAVKDYVEMPGLMRFRAAVRKVGCYKELEAAQDVLAEIYGQIAADSKVYEMPADRSSV